MAKVTMTLEEYQDLEDKLSTLAMGNHNLKEERDDFREQRDELINDMAEVKRKAEAWIDLKKEMVEMYPVLVIDVETTSGECEKGMLYQLGKHLRRMDELDGTQEFRNLLSDLERGSDEYSRN